MRKEIPFQVRPAGEFTLDTRKMQVPDFVDAFLSPAVDTVREMIRDGKLKSVAAAIDAFTDLVDEEFTYFLRHNEAETKEEVLEWLMESVVGGYMSHFLKTAANKAFEVPEKPMSEGAAE